MLIATPTSTFIEKARAVHGDKYSYETTEYSHSLRNVRIVCHAHGIFEQLPSNHLAGRGCRACAADARRDTRASFIKKADEIHGGKYLYHSVNYTSSYTDVTINCPEHGDFIQRPNNHLNGAGCPACIGRMSRSTETFISRAKAIHGDRYSYENVDYINHKIPVKIVCFEHGIFEQQPSGHLNGSGCPACGGVARGTTQTFIEQATSVHDGEYSYELAEYTNRHTKLSIVCPDHGDFDQRPNDHLRGQGCPNCYPTRSSYELDLEVFLTQHGIAFESENKTILAPKHLDFYLPDNNLAIEINGLRFHNDSKRPDRYHYDKWKGCHDQGIQLLHINEDEWITKKSILKNRLLVLSGKGTRGVGARLLTIRKISNKAAAAFTDKHHIQGKTPTNTSFGAFHGDLLVGVMTFSAQRTNKNVVELSRFCSDGKLYPGMFSKMFKFAVETEGYSEIWSYADRRYSHGGLYLRNNFIHMGDTNIDYRYVVPGRPQTLSKNKFTKKQIAKKFGITEGSESEIMSSLGYTRIYDCGKMRFVWRSPQSKEPNPHQK